MTAGLRATVTERLSLGVDGAWTTSKAGLDPLKLAAPGWAATHPAQAFDYSLSDGYSDSSVARSDVGLEGRYLIRPNFWMTGRYRYANLDDRDPYLFDTTGRIAYWSVSFGRAF